VISQDALEACNIENNFYFYFLKRRKFERQECKATINEQRNKQKTIALGDIKC
jgi:hypothetical protein